MCIRALHIITEPEAFRESAGLFLKNFIDLTQNNLTMNDYFQELRKAQGHFHKRFYPTAIRECGSIIETGLKELYRNLEQFLEEHGRALDLEDMHAEFENTKNEPFQFDRATLGSMLLFANKTRFWEHLKNMCESNLSFIPMINWYQVRHLRNESTHGRKILGRSDALEMLFYTKVFLYDCGLIEGISQADPEILDAHCLNCDFKINQEWNYCPSCGHAVDHYCHNCGRKLSPAYRICPHCDSQRMCRADVREAESIYRRYAEAVWADWEVTPMERKWLQTKRLELGLSPKEAEKVENQVIPKNYNQFLNLVAATNLDGVIDDDEEYFLTEKAKELGIAIEAAQKIINSSRKESNKIRKNLLKIRFL